MTTPPTIWRNPIYFTAFGFGSGAMPFAPGTFGSLLGIVFYLLIVRFSLVTQAVICLIAFVIGCWLCHKTSKDLGVHDHPGIVWDEIVGMTLVLLASPPGVIWLCLGFILFRIFDIAKPQPIAWINQHIRNGIGIMLDDVAAAIPAWIILQVVAWLYIKISILI